MKTFLFFLLTFISSSTVVFYQVEISGGVYDVKTSVPIADVQLTWNGNPVGVTNAQGLYTFKAEVSTANTLQLSKKNYVTKTVQLDVKEDLIINFSMEIINEHILPSVYIFSDVLNKNTSMTYQKIDVSSYQKQNHGEDLPTLIRNELSVQSTSDAGNGVGYTGIRLRGSDATRINVCINDVPINDAESQQVYWVDIPDAMAMATDMQLQRGVGTSTNGVGAFGGSLNIKTDKLDTTSWKEIGLSYGSFKTFRLHAATQFAPFSQNKNIQLKARASYISSQGYIERASSRLFSHYVQLSLPLSARTQLDLINFGGKEKTYQAWYGVPEDSLQGHPRFNPAGMYSDTSGSLKYYDDQTDNYFQNYTQAILKYKISPRIQWKNVGFFTKGKGYYQNYKEDKAYSDYTSDTTTQTYDIIDRKWLNNDFYGWISQLIYYKENHKFILGGSINHYQGDHYSTIYEVRNSYTEQIVSELQTEQNFFLNDATKNDQNIFIKAEINPNKKWHLYGDMQVRHVSYAYDILSTNTTANADYTFFNPKLGASVDLNEKSLCYASFAVGNKEPNRDDHVNSSATSRPKAERLYDIELGYRYLLRNTSFEFNFYNMQYKNQLVLNGKINDVGEYTRVNVENSYRRGLEASVRFVPLNRVIVKWGATLSQNKIIDYNDYIDVYDGTQLLNIYHNTDIAFSPQALLYSKIIFQKELYSFMLDTRFVSRQYLDNTSTATRSIDPYFVNDFTFQLELPIHTVQQLGLTFKVQNLLNEKYESNGYTYSYMDAPTSIYTYNAYFPQATRHYSLGFFIRF